MKTDNELRDELAEQFVPTIEPTGEAPLLEKFCANYRDENRVAFKAGWDACVEHQECGDEGSNRSEG